MATQFRARPSEMLFATSKPVGEFSNAFRAPVRKCDVYHCFTC
jgi:hypothetical protein